MLSKLDGKRLFSTRLLLEKALVDAHFGDLNSDGEIHALDSVPVMFANKPQIEMFPNEYGAAKFDSTSDESWAEAHFYAECSEVGVLM